MSPPQGGPASPCASYGVRTTPMDAQIQRQPAASSRLEGTRRIPALASREACISLRPYSR